MKIYYKLKIICMLNSNILIKLVIFRVHNSQLEVLLNDNHLPHSPFITTMPLDEIAQTILTQATGVSMSDQFMEQLYTFSEKQEVYIAYYVLIGAEEVAISEGFSWHNTSPLLRGNDAEIIRYASQRLAWKVEYTNVIYSLLPPTCTLTQLQSVYETVLGHTLDKRNFRKKIMSLKFIEPTGEKHVQQARPAQMYRFISRKPLMVKVFS